MVNVVNPIVKQHLQSMTISIGCINHSQTLGLWHWVSDIRKVKKKNGSEQLAKDGKLVNGLYLPDSDSKGFLSQ